MRGRRRRGCEVIFDDLHTHHTWPSGLASHRPGITPQAVPIDLSVVTMAAMQSVQAFTKLRDQHLLRIFTDQALARGFARTLGGSRYYSTPPAKEDHAPTAATPSPSSPTASPTEKKGDWAEVVHQSGGIYWWNQRTGGAATMRELLLLLQASAWLPVLGNSCAWGGGGAMTDNDGHDQQGAWHS